MNYNPFQNPFSVGREELISISGLGSKNTYHKSIEELHDFGYIHYRSSESKFRKIRVHMFRLDIEKKVEELQQLDLFNAGNSQENMEGQSAPGMENPVPENADATVPEMVPGEPQNCPGNDPATVPKGVPSASQNWDTISPKNGTQSVPKLVPVQYQNCDTHSPKNGTATVPNLGHNNINSKQLKSKVERVNTNALAQFKISENDLSGNADPYPGDENKQPAGPALFLRASGITQVLSFFKKNNYPDLEAKKFFNHYQSTGWLVGVTPMSDWHSSAHKWMLNIGNFKNFNPPKTEKNASSKTNYTNDKNFSEPL